uniref:Signal peptide-containing protein n=1 Tax=Caenorhabditis tropicalis TaxID=1561998 RepID=A0A1I7TVE2_9PELO
MSVVFRCLLLLLIASVSIDAVTTKFRFNGTIYCAYPFAEKDDFIFDILVKEWDLLSLNDHIGMKHTLNLTRVLPMSEKKIAYEIEAEEQGDVIDILKKYEIYFWVRHDCTPKGTKVWKKVHIDKEFPIIDGEYVHTEDFRVTKITEENAWGILGGKRSIEEEKK